MFEKASLDLNSVNGPLDEFVKVIDFGSSCFLGEMAGGVSGNYGAPEIQMGVDLPPTSESDIFSFCVVASELVFSLDVKRFKVGITELKADKFQGTILKSSIPKIH